MPTPGKPLMVIDADHRSGIVSIIGITALVVSLICLLIRVYVRALLSPPFGHDDYIFIVAIISAIIQTSLMVNNASRGFGHSIYLLSSQQISQIQQTTAATDSLYLLSIFLSKCSVLGILWRLTPRHAHHRMLRAIFGLSACWLISSILLLLVNCGLNHPWAKPADQCHGLLHRWQYITSMNMITEMMLFLFSAHLVKCLQMPITRKLIVLCCFAVRLPVIAFSALHLRYLGPYIHSFNPTLDIIDTYVWIQLEINYSIIACTSFCIVPFMHAISTDYGTAGEVTLGSSSVNSTSARHIKDRARRFHDIALQSIARGKPQTQANDSPDAHSIASAESTRMMLGKTVESTVVINPR